MKEFKIGKIGEKPEVKSVQTKNGKEFTVANTTLFIYDAYAKKNAKGYRYGIPVKVTAWNKMASELSSYDKGDLIGVMGSSRAEVYEDKAGKVRINYGLVASSIYNTEQAQAINNQLRKLMGDFEKGEIEKIYDIEAAEVIEKTAAEIGIEMERERSAEFEIEDPDIVDVLEAISQDEDFAEGFRDLDVDMPF